MKNIVLIGFMGSGKSMVSKKLMTRLKCEVISTDQLIEKSQGRPITEIFTNEGEKVFRQIERDVIASIADRKNVIIDTGGGIVLHSENIKNLKKNGLVFYLKASLETIYACVQGRKHRPLLNVDDPKAKIKELLNARKDLYEQAADHVIISDGHTIDEMVDAIMAIIDK